MKTATSQPQTTAGIACVDVERSLKRYARDLDVSLDHIILASLQMVVADRAAAQQPIAFEARQPRALESFQLS